MANANFTACAACGNSVSRAASSCPRCGHPVGANTNVGPSAGGDGIVGAPAANVTALLALTCGILSIGVAFIPSEASWFSVVLSLLAIILSVVALNRHGPSVAGERGVAVAGLMAGSLGLLLFVFALTVLYGAFGDLP